MAAVQPIPALYRPQPILHTCDGTDKRTCACSARRRRQREAERRGARVAAREAAGQRITGGLGLGVGELAARRREQRSRCAGCQEESERLVPHWTTPGVLAGLLCPGCARLALIATPGKLRGLAAFLEDAATQAEEPDGDPETGEVNLAPIDLPPHLRERIHVTEGGCWRWTGSVADNGYVQVGYRGQRWMLHRLVRTLLLGPIPPGMTLDHTCHDATCPATEPYLCVHRRCCNPLHAVIETRGRNASRSRRERSRCPRDHEYDRVDRRGWRKCSTCERERKRRRLAG